ncbi:hypothetical protein AVEN_208099-1 [Araneus ventricosus]|uniref:Uncharacterized protein n=1 Tax=Araneus ventricosus TaxID=182803 RepID=A0A4Y2FXB1_ARAVE|nr:hypothetical protein AVEN_208099-1 [Araneus ventricosus]
MKETAMSPFEQPIINYRHGPPKYRVPHTRPQRSDELLFEAAACLTPMPRRLWKKILPKFSQLDDVHNFCNLSERFNAGKVCSD